MQNLLNVTWENVVEIPDACGVKTTEEKRKLLIKKKADQLKEIIKSSNSTILIAIIYYFSNRSWGEPQLILNPIIWSPTQIPLYHRYGGSDYPITLNEIQQPCGYSRSWVLNVPAPNKRKTTRFFDDLSIKTNNHHICFCINPSIKDMDILRRYVIDESWNNDPDFIGLKGGLRG